MGFLEKAVAYRWVTQGRGGGGGGGTALGLVLMIFLAIALAIYAVFAAMSAVTSAIYNLVRPVLVFAPHLTTFLAGLLLVGVVNVVVAYPPGKARKILSSTDDSLSYYARAIGTITLLGGGLFAFDAGYFYYVSDEMNPLAEIGLAAVLVYLIYKYFLVLYQTHRLVRCAPNGVLYSTAVLLPITTGTVITIFNVPTNYPDYGALSVVSVISVPIILGAALVKYRAEPHIPEAGSADADGERRGTDDEPDDRDGGSEYECLDCNLLVESDSHPRTCEQCGGIVKAVRHAAD